MEQITSSDLLSLENHQIILGNDTLKIAINNNEASFLLIS